jgi:hypothetical protein
METHSPLGKRKEEEYYSEMATTKKKTVKKAPAKRKPASPEHKIATNALKLVDEAATLLRKGISTGADTSEKARLEAKKKAHVLIGKAKSSLESLIEESASTLRKVVNKI